MQALILVQVGFFTASWHSRIGNKRKYRTEPDPLYCIWSGRLLRLQRSVLLASKATPSFSSCRHYETRGKRWPLGNKADVRPDLRRRISATYIAREGRSACRALACKNYLVEPWNISFADVRDLPRPWSTRPVRQQRA